MPSPSPAQLGDLSVDLQVELAKLSRLVEGLESIGAVEADPLRVDAVALRLQSLYTGIERCLVQIARVLNGGSPDGWEWHRRLLERMGQATDQRPAVFSAATIAELQDLLRFRHLVRHLYAYELRPQPVEELRLGMVRLWPDVLGELQRFRGWLIEAAEALP
jgi:hypothetical protein